MFAVTEIGGLSPEAVAAVDRAGLAGDVLAQPDHIEDALERCAAASLPELAADGGLDVCGMGGSAIGGDLAAAVLGARARRRVTVVRGYGDAAVCGPERLVACASYSGNTEETLSCYEAAGAVGAPRVAITTGGELRERCRVDGVPVIELPPGLQPRAAVVYLLVAMLELAARCGAAPSLLAEIESAAGLLRSLGTAWGPAA